MVNRRVFQGVQMTDVADIMIVIAGQLARWKPINEREKKNEN